MNDVSFFSMALVVAMSVGLSVGSTLWPKLKYFQSSGKDGGQRMNPNDLVIP